MATVYVIQIWVHHGVGTQGWRSVGRRVGEHYRFSTREAALEAMRQHFGNLQEGHSVRVHAIEEEEPEENAGYPGGADGSQRQ
jgi:hypothetical protein